MLLFLLKLLYKSQLWGWEGCPVVEDTICVWQAEGWALGPQDD